MRRLRQLRPDGELTLSQTSALVRLDRDGPATSSELAAREGIRPQSMGAIVAALCERGLVARDPDPTTAAGSSSRSPPRGSTACSAPAASARAVWRPPSPRS